MERGKKSEVIGGRARLPPSNLIPSAGCVLGKNQVPWKPKTWENAAQQELRPPDWRRGFGLQTEPNTTRGGPC